MKRFFVAALAALVLGAVFQGGGRELSQRLLVRALALDACPEGVALTLRAADPGGEEERVLSAVGDSPAAALSALGTQTGREPFLGHCALAVIGEDLARGRLEEALGFLLEEPQVRPTMPVCVATGEGAGLLCAQGEGGLLPVEELAHLPQAAQGLPQDLLGFVNRIS